MQMPFDPEISIYQTVRDNTGSTIPLSVVVDMIRNGQFADKTGATRDAVLDGDKDEADRLKKELPSVTFAGTFSRRAKAALVKSSGLLVLDLDKISDDAFESIQSKATATPFVVLAFVSPSGNGYKIIIRIGDDPAEYERYFRAACRWAADVLGIEPDQSGKDISRLCFLCSDPQAYFNPNATVFPVDKYNPPAPKTRQNATVRATRPLNKNAAAHIFERARKYLAAMPPAVSGQNGHDTFFTATNAIVHGFALGDTYEARVLIDEYNRRCEPPFSASEVRHKIESAIEHPPEKPTGWLLNDDRSRTSDFENCPSDGAWELPDSSTAPKPERRKPKPRPRENIEIPDELLSMPGFVDAFIQHCMATAPYPSRAAAFTAGVCLLSFLTGRRIRDALNNRTNVYLINLMMSGGGKDHPRKVISSVLAETGQLPGLLNRCRPCDVCVRR